MTECKFTISAEKADDIVEESLIEIVERLIEMMKKDKVNFPLRNIELIEYRETRRE